MFRIALRFAMSVLLLACTQWSVAADTSPPKGSLVIIGGNLRPSNSPVWERVIQLAGGKGARIAVFASASGTPEKSGKFLVDRLNSYGAKAFFVPVAVKLSGSDYQIAADDPGLPSATPAAPSSPAATRSASRARCATRTAAIPACSMRYGPCTGAAA
jgi:cyanophycinase